MLHGGSKHFFLFQACTSKALCDPNAYLSTPGQNTSPGNERWWNSKSDQYYPIMSSTGSWWCCYTVLALDFSELSYLRIAGIDSKAMRVKVVHGKGAKDRFTILSQAVLLELRAYLSTIPPWRISLQRSELRVIVIVKGVLRRLSKKPY